MQKYLSILLFVLNPLCAPAQDSISLSNVNLRQIDSLVAAVDGNLTLTKKPVQGASSRDAYTGTSFVDLKTQVVKLSLVFTSSGTQETIYAFNKRAVKIIADGQLIYCFKNEYYFKDGGRVTDKNLLGDLADSQSILELVSSLFIPLSN